MTLTIQDREEILGSIAGDVVQLSRNGEIVWEEWPRTSMIRSEVLLDEFVVMPDHLHGIIVICEERNGVYSVGANGDSPQRITPYRSPSRTLGAIIRGFKGASTNRINEERGTPHVRVWQGNYYEHIIPDERDYRRIQKYILENPLRLAMNNELIPSSIAQT